jgi:2-polyprenyl-3-methyl-5-hydroxy-6-metoxy-1,4-benzoquinol methylase
MMVWEDKNQFPDTTSLADRLEEIGRPIIEKYSQPAILHDQENGRYWFNYSKVWEYPFALHWLDKLAQHLGKTSLKIMDFGCWLCPFPEYLAQMGHTVWGVDDDSWGHIRQCGALELYPHVKYHIADVRTLVGGEFDAIISCSVLEHIEPTLRIELLNHLKSMLQPQGKQMHMVDFYFPEKPNRDHQRMNFWDVATRMGWDVGEVRLCPGSPDFNFNALRGEISFVRGDKEARIAIGDDF